MIKMSVTQDDLTRMIVDAIVNPANSYGYMGGGVAGVIKKYGGEEIETEAVEQAPIPIGHAVVTTAGNLKARHVIHSPTMEQPAEKICIDNVTEAVTAALICADEEGFERIAMPGMGTGVGELDKMEAAQKMADAIVSFDAKLLKEIILCDNDKDMVAAFRIVFGIPEEKD